MEINNKYISTEAFQNFSSVYLNNLINFVLKKQNIKIDWIEIWLVMIVNFYQEEPFFSDRRETIEKHFHLKGYDTMNRPGRNWQY